MNKQTVPFRHGYRAVFGWAGRLATVLAVGAAAVGAALPLLDRAELPCGSKSMLGLELATTSERATAVVAGCTVRQVHGALLWDVPLILLYVLVLGLTAWRLGPRCYRVRSLRALGPRVGWLAVLAGGLDLLEDAALYLAVGAGGGGTPPVDAAGAEVAAVAAWGKFLLLAGAVAYVAGAAAGYVATPRAVRDAIAAYQRTIEEGRKAHRREGQRTGGGTDHDYRICLSGGGVRSASFGLGALQELEAYPTASPQPLAWRKARQVSAVSGGAYMAAAWAIARTPHDGGSGDPSAWSAGSPEEGWLRAHLGYLLEKEPRGHPADRDAMVARDAPGALSTLVAGTAVNAGVIAGLLWLVARPVGWLEASCPVAPWLHLAYTDPEPFTCPGSLQVTARDLALGPQHWLPPAVYAALGVALLLLGVCAGQFRFLGGPARVIAGAARFVHQRSRPLAYGCLALAVALLLVLVAFPAAMTVMPRLLSLGSSQPPSEGPVTGVITTLSGLGVLGAVAQALRAPLVRMAPRLGGVVLLVGGTVLGGLWADGAATGHASVTGYLWALAVAGLLYAVVSPEWWSLASFYRGRLRRAYATYRDGGDVTSYANGDGAEGPAEPSVYAYKPKPGQQPGLLVNTAMTVSDRSVRTHAGVPAHRVTFAGHDVCVFAPRDDDGDYDELRCPARHVETLHHRWDSPRLTTMATVAMSGAAIAPAMGRFNYGSTKALLAFANVRTGSWVPNPVYARALLSAGVAGAPGASGGPVADPLRWPDYPRLRVGYLIKEIMNLHDPADLYVYLSDGGHWENTGLVDLLRGGVPDEVVCLDGSGVPLDRVTSLAEAIGLARLECDVDVRIDLDPLRADPAKGYGHDYAERCVGLGLMVNRRGPTPDVGLLWYAKPTVTRHSPPSALAYRERYGTFPATSTLNQLFDTEQFEAYRDLGRYAARALLDARQALVHTIGHAAALTDLRSAAGHSGAHWAVVALARLVGTAEYAALRSKAW